MSDSIDLDEEAAAEAEYRRRNEEAEQRMMAHEPYRRLVDRRRKVKERQRQHAEGVDAIRARLGYTNN